MTRNIANSAPTHDAIHSNQHVSVLCWMMRRMADYCGDGRDWKMRMRVGVGATMCAETNRIDRPDFD